MTLHQAYNRIREHIDSNHSDFRIDITYTTFITDEVEGDVGLTWEYGEPCLHRTADFSISTCLHNDVSVYIEIIERTNLATGEVSTSSSMSEGDAHNFGATDFPDLSKFVMRVLTEMMRSMAT